MVRLHVNVDHVATVRQARRATFPDPVEWAVRAERAGAHGITCHLRADRRHIQDDDVRRLRASVKTLLNLEISLDVSMIEHALLSGADAICQVPENRQEVTTEGGLDVLAEHARIERVVPDLSERGAVVSLFIDPERDQLAAAADTGAPFVELHTGRYANARESERARELARLADAAAFARSRGLRVNAGHGLDYENVAAVAAIDGIEELNIGFAIVARALFAGVDEAIRSMLDACGGGR